MRIHAPLIEKEVYQMHRKEQDAGSGTEPAGDVCRRRGRDQKEQKEIDQYSLGLKAQLILHGKIAQ